MPGPGFDELRTRLAELEEAADSARSAAREAELRAATSDDERAPIAAKEARKRAATTDSERRVALEAFADYTDPRSNVERLPDAAPMILLPLRLETRFGTVIDERTGQQRTELWVRIYPDDCSVNAFDPALSTAEVAAGVRFWQQYWRAGGVDVESRSAWRNLAGGYGMGRARWIVDAFTPANPDDRPAKHADTDLVLVISATQLPSDRERSFLATYWTSVWSAGGDQASLGEAWTTLVDDLGSEAEADSATAAYAPFNLADPPPPGRDRLTTNVIVGWLQLPPDSGEERLGWRAAPTARALPERFVLTLFPAGGVAFDVLGPPIVEPLYVGPDPAGEQIVPIDGGLQIPDPLKWMFDFDAAVAAGMGLRVPLSGDQAANGFDRIVAVGIRMRSDARTGSAEFEQLLAGHARSRSGFELLSQGVATNNDDGMPTTWSRRDDPDLAYDDVFGPDRFHLRTDPIEKRDGQVFAERVGVDPESMLHVRGADGCDSLEALAMNRALFPGTLGYLAGTMMSPVFDGWEGELSWYFTTYVAGRGSIPALRIGAQPYGVIASTAFSRMSWLDRPLDGREVISQSRRWQFLQRLDVVLRGLEPLWRARLDAVPRVGSNADPHQTLLDALGLHPNSAEFHIRYGKHLDELVSRGALAALNVVQMAKASDQRRHAAALLRSLGYEGDEPDLLNLFFRTRQSALIGPLVEGAPLSESLELAAATADGRNYLTWLAETAAVSLDAVRRREGFVADTPPKALLYILLQFALTRGYLVASDRLRSSSGLFTADELLAMHHEPTSIHVQEGASETESPWRRLYETDARLTGSPTATIAEHLTSVLGAGRDYAVDLDEQIRAVEALEHAPTARLERGLVEHIDALTYRYDAWRLGLVTWQLEQMRASGDQKRKGGSGLYLGSYGWVEDVRPKAHPLPAPELPPHLAETFDGDRPLTVDPTNGGHLHAPSLNQAVTAAILRAGELANRTPGAPGAFAINLSSERVRLADGLLEGLRTGQSLSALLGYRLERALHEDGGIVELDALIFAFRRAFPLTAGKLTPTQDPPPPDSEAIEARNVTDGLALVIQAGPTGAYPYGKKLPNLASVERTAVEGIVRDLVGVFDALADLLLSEGVHQAAQSSPERAGAHIDIQGDFTAPPEPAVIRTPTRGVALTCRFGLELDPSATAGANASPRVKAQPALNAWLGDSLPEMTDIACRVVWTVAGGPEHSRVVTLADLGLAPIDALELISDEGGADLSELDDRVRGHIESVANPRADAAVSIRYMEGGPGKLSVFMASALFKRLRGLAFRSRPLRAGDVVLASQGHDVDATPHVVARTRLASVVGDLTGLQADLDASIAAGAPLIGDPVGNRAALLAGIDDRIGSVARLLARVATFGGARAGWGALYQWRAGRFSVLLSRTSELLDRWQGRLDECESALAAELAPGATTQQRVGLLRAAEGQVSTALAPQTNPVQLRPVVLAKHDAFVAKRDAIQASVIDAAGPSLADRLARCDSVLPISSFDPQPLGFADIEDSVIEYWSDLQTLLTTARADIHGRIQKATDALSAHDAAVDPSVRLSAMQLGADAIFGEGFKLIPTFTLPAVAGADQTLAHAHFLSGGLLAHARIATGVDNPLDTWLYGAARVRPKVRLLEDMLMLWDAHEVGTGSLAVVQLPHSPGAPWLALDFPKEDAPDGERMTYVALAGPGYDPANERCGLLVDEWNETIPAVEPLEDGPQHTTGVAFNFDRPSQEPPQAMLLLTPATWDGRWSWEDILGGVIDTFELARLRAVEPDQLGETPLAQFLPATIASVTTSGLSPSANFALANTDLKVARAP
jgi:hypothetical protein